MNNSKVIYKAILPSIVFDTDVASDTNITNLSIPRESKFLRIKLQAGLPVIWFLCDEDAEIVQRRILGVYTNQKFTNSGEYLGTVGLDNNKLIIHYFDLGEIKRKI